MSSSCNCVKTNESPNVSWNRDGRQRQTNVPPISTPGGGTRAAHLGTVAGVVAAAEVGAGLNLHRLPPAPFSFLCRRRCAAASGCAAHPRPPRRLHGGGRCTAGGRGARGRLERAGARELRLGRHQVAARRRCFRERRLGPLLRRRDACAERVARRCVLCVIERGRAIRGSRGCSKKKGGRSTRPSACSRNTIAPCSTRAPSARSTARCSARAAASRRRSPALAKPHAPPRRAAASHARRAAARAPGPPPPPPRCFSPSPHAAMKAPNTALCACTKRLATATAAAAAAAVVVVVVVVVAASAEPCCSAGAKIPWPPPMANLRAALSSSASSASSCASSGGRAGATRGGGGSDDSEDRGDASGARWKVSMYGAASPKSTMAVGRDYREGIAACTSRRCRRGALVKVLTEARTVCCLSQPGLIASVYRSRNLEVAFRTLLRGQLGPEVTQEAILILSSDPSAASALAVLQQAASSSTRRSPRLAFCSSPSINPINAIDRRRSRSPFTKAI